MYKDWVKLIPELRENLNNTSTITCPECGAHEIDYMYVVKDEEGLGYLQVWCNKCLKGIYISRTKAPEGAKTVSINEQKLENIIPEYTFLDN